MPTTTVATTSKQWLLGVTDFAKALLIAALTTPATVLFSSFAAGHFSINWTTEWQLAVTGASAYLLKNWASPSQTTIKGVPPGATTTIKVPAPGTTTNGG